MKKVILLILVSILLLLAFTSCAKIKSLFAKDNSDDVGNTDNTDNTADTGNTDNDDDQDVVEECEHVWAEATCQAPKTCTLCAVTVGAPTNHKTVAATCTTPQMCSVCGYTSEYWKPALGHDWKEASCLVTDPVEKAKPWEEQRGTPKTCRTCGLVEGEALGHKLVDATCTTPAHCEVCTAINYGINDGTELGHNRVAMPSVTPTCANKGSEGGEWCGNCHEIYVNATVLPKLEHELVQYGGVPATCTETGMKPGEKCNVCGEIFEEPSITDPIGHRRDIYDSEGEKIGEAELKGETYVDENGNSVPACTATGTAYYNCTLCTEAIYVVIPAKDHIYPDGASCDSDATCATCGKGIEHEYANPTCTAPATCKNPSCGAIDETRPAINHEGHMVAANCQAPATCSLCDYTEGESTSHKLSFKIYRGVVQYSCATCDSTFIPATESYYLDGSNHDNMYPVNNYITGYITAPGSDGNPTNLPVIKTDADGNKYYSLIRDNRDPDKGSDGNPLRPQIQLWVPMNRAGFAGFNSASSSVGFYSFRINAYMDEGMTMSFVEASSGWSEADAIQNIFSISMVQAGDLIDPDDENSGRYQKILVTGLDHDGDLGTPALLLKELDVTGKTTLEDMFSGWFDVYIGIVFNGANDTFSLHYYIDGEYIGTVTKSLLTAGNGIKCVYISGNSAQPGSGLMIDDIAFGYLVGGEWNFDSDHTHTFDRVYDQASATCVNDGYIVYKCTGCGAIGNKKVTPALGHKEGEMHDAKAVTCLEDGHTAYSVCTECGVEIGKTIIPTTGHDYEVKLQGTLSCESAARARKTCKSCGYQITETLEALGHLYANDADCTSGSTCIREGCGYVNKSPIGHVWAPATCTAPSTCTREGCGATTGEKLSHTMAPATCAAPSTCTMCGEYTEGYKLIHTLSYKYKDSKVVYFCPICDTSFTITNGYYLNGYNHDGMSGTSKNQNFTVEENTNLPLINDQHYELLSNTDTKAQFELWIPKDDTSEGFGYSATSHSSGVFSFKINAKIVGESADTELNISIIDGPSNQGANRWTTNGVAAKINISKVDSKGKMALKLNAANSSGQYTTIFTYTFDMDGANGFTGWTDVAFGMTLDSDADQITYHCYIDGIYKGSFSREFTTTANSINCVYFSGYTAGKGTGIMLDDVAFGYAANTPWNLDECQHKNGRTKTVHAPTCTEEGYTEWICEECGHCLITDRLPTLGGHIGGYATCTTKAKCIRCDKYYGDTLGGHVGGNPTCEDMGVCTRQYDKVVSYEKDKDGNYVFDANGKLVVNTTKVTCNTKYMDALGHIPTGATCANAPIDIRKEATCARVIGQNDDGTDIICGHVIKGSYADCTGGQATCTDLANCQWCGNKYGEVYHTNLVGATCSSPEHCPDCGYTGTYMPTHNPVPAYAEGVLSYACKYCQYTLTLENSYFHDGTTLNGFSATDESNVFNSTNDQKANIVTDKNGNKYYEFVLNSGAQEKKASVWTPNSNGGIKDFEGFTMKDNTIGVFSIDLNIYLLSELNMRFVDTDTRGGGDQKHLLKNDFWTDGALSGNFFTATPINSNNQVTLKGYDSVKKTITVTSDDKYTGWFNLTVGIVMDSSSNTITLHYYIDGEFIGTASKNMNIVTGKIDGVYITNAGVAQTGATGSGYKFDNIGFGYAKLDADGNLPILPPATAPETDPVNAED